jgi:hypothetical protein
MVPKFLGLGALEDDPTLEAPPAEETVAGELLILGRPFLFELEEDEALGGVFLFS